MESIVGDALTLKLSRSKRSRGDVRDKAEAEMLGGTRWRPSVDDAGGRGAKL
jgi:hypothetical protein